MRYLIKIVYSYFDFSIFIERAWSFFPVFILIVLGVPSLWGLYELETNIRVLNILVMGAQWYWKYNFLDSNIQVPDLFRLVSLNEGVFLFSNLEYLVRSSRGDVLHSWSLPRLGLKLDVVPGRINILSLKVPVGVFFGFCSELCGVGHSFIPISIYSVV